MLPSVSAPTSPKAKPSSALAPLDRRQALAVYRQLVLIRRAEEKIREDYAGNEMRTPVHLGIGQEGIVVGVCQSVPPKTTTFGTYRNHALYLAVTEDTDGFFAELYGKATGPGKGKAGSMHMAAPAHGLLATSAVVATTIPLGVGAALAHAYRRSGGLAVTFFGDGAVEEGVFWESLNFACLKRLPMLFVCEDNELAIHTPARARQGFRSIPEALQGFACHVLSAEGSDVLQVMAATRQLLQRMQEQPQPGFLHCRYLRFLEHVGPSEDFAVGYRAHPTPAQLAQQDPVRRLAQALREDDCPEAELARIQAAVDEQIARSVEAARQAPFAGPEELHTDVLA